MNKKLCICGTHPDTRDNAPFDDLTYDIWVFNEAPQADWCKRWTACFQMHRPAVYESPNNFVNQNHWDWLQQDHGDDKIIYMQNIDPRVPNSVRFPLDEMSVNFTPVQPVDGIFFTSTAAMALALGLYLGYEYIELTGVDLSSNTEYSYQQACFLYWAGVGRAMLGKNFVLKSGLHHFVGKPLYGYQGETQIEREFFAQRAEKHQADCDRNENRLKKVKSRLADAIIDRKYDQFPRFFTECMAAAQDAGESSGRLQEAKTYAERPDPIPRQQFERRGATGQRDAQVNSFAMEKEGGKVEYVFNAWKSTGAEQALQQLRLFVEQAIKYAVIAGGNTGVMTENMLYLEEYDKRVQAAGGERTLIALGVNNGSN